MAARDPHGPRAEPLQKRDDFSPTDLNAPERPR
jgi:hypothetical protein